MAEQESLEFGKADFVLMDAVTMPEFMANLRLRCGGQRPLRLLCLGPCEVTELHRGANLAQNWGIFYEMGLLGRAK
uniref:Uncharacterized protein n=1 Tax=Buteo japonicus TaxID=224669 RepID=A0A8C0BNB7_9AVES